MKNLWMYHSGISKCRRRYGWFSTSFHPHWMCQWKLELIILFLSSITYILEPLSICGVPAKLFCKNTPNARSPRPCNLNQNQWPLYWMHVYHTYFYLLCHPLENYSSVFTTETLHEHLIHNPTCFYLLQPPFDYFGFVVPLKHCSFPSTNINLCVLAWNSNLKFKENNRRWLTDENLTLTCTSIMDLVSKIPRAIFSFSTISWFNNKLNGSLKILTEHNVNPSKVWIGVLVWICRTSANFTLTANN